MLKERERERGCKYVMDVVLVVLVWKSVERIKGEEEDARLPKGFFYLWAGKKVKVYTPNTGVRTARAWFIYQNKRQCLPQIYYCICATLS